MPRTSLQIFRAFISRRSDDSLDASGVISRECFEAWRKSRKGQITNAERQFQRALSAHLAALDGRLPFSVEEEQAVLLQVRKREVWPCFKSNGSVVGSSGFRSKGYHEKLKKTTTAVTTVVATTSNSEVIGSRIASHTNEESIAFWTQYVGSLASTFDTDPDAFWNQIGQVWKYVLYARSSASVTAQFTQETANELCLKYSTEYPTEFVSVSTAFSTSFSCVVLAENNESVNVFGSALGRGRNGYISFTDVLRLFRPIAMAYFDIGQVQHFTVRAECKPGEWRDCHAKVVVDAKSLFLTVIGTATAVATGSDGGRLQ
ncbi:hypothetical protein BASA81_007926 [Batrachochytrium salamandrivorans]|nr:hypothetical protein BASA81_007926 [Batrachochytrium salamandrivorans]